MARAKFNSVDEYISFFTEDIKERLELIRKTIKKELPKEIEEVISYQIPTFKLHGKYVIYFAGFKNHISIYPIPPGDEKFQKEIEPFRKGVGTLQFPNDKDLPIGIVKLVTKQALEYNLKRTGNY
jgi:uncharacterized protein YdhG (YjbR/CyaY superfamily)